MSMSVNLQCQQQQPELHCLQMKWKSVFYQYCLLSPAFLQHLFFLQYTVLSVLSQPENEAKSDDNATLWCNAMHGLYCNHRLKILFRRSNDHIHMVGSLSGIGSIVTKEAFKGRWDVEIEVDW